MEKSPSPLAEAQLQTGKWSDGRMVLLFHAHSHTLLLNASNLFLSLLLYSELQRKPRFTGVTVCIDDLSLSVNPPGYLPVEATTSWTGSHQVNNKKEISIKLLYRSNGLPNT